MRNSEKNIITGITSQFIMLSIGLVLPRYVLLIYGSEVNGLLGTMNQFISYLTLFEAGIGAASLQALYRAIGLQNKKSVSGILSATGKHYQRTGWLSLLMTGVLSVLFPFLLNTDIPFGTVVILTLVTGTASVFGFFFYSKNLLLLQAENKSFIINAVTICVFLLISGLKLISLRLSLSIIVYQSLTLLQMMLYAAFYVIYFRKNYKWIDKHAKPDTQAVSQHRSAFVHQLSSLVFSNTDILIISIGISVTVSSVYMIYNLVFSTIGNLLVQFYSGFKAKLGQLFHADRELYLEVYKAYEAIYIAFGFALNNVAYVMVLPFLTLYTKGIIDANYLDPNLALLFVSINLLSVSRMPLGETIFFAGHFSATKWYSIIESLINLIASLLLVRPFGVYGVLFGTILALIYRVANIIWYVDKHILKGGWKDTLRTLVINIMLFVVLTLFVHHLGLTCETYLDFILIAGILTIIFISIFVGVNAALNRKQISKLYHVMVTGVNC